ncbi:efflux RND transporter periplasmic adaptor subunit [Ancylomarina sp.]|uniref:efflux RND transporter periplasmic adaptor subunit n=1 Tax=Ancylomarina sp. TaxID=1970196 RepID=UPI003567D254
MKKIIIAGLIPLLFACSAKNADENKDKTEKLKEYRTELKVLKEKISKLESEVNKGAKKEMALNVNVEKLNASKFEHFIQITGNVEADKNITIQPETSGNIISIDVKEGQHVKQGDVIAQLNFSKLQNDIDELKTQLALSKTLFDRQKRLWNQKIGSEVEFLTIKSNLESLKSKLSALESQKDLAIVRAPFDGIIDEIYQRTGEMAGPSTPLAQLVNINRVYVEGDVSETYLNSIKAGGTAQLDFPAINYQTEAPIYRTSNVIDPANRSFKVRVNLKNPGQIIKPNLISIIKIRDFVQNEALVVPSIIIKKDFEGSYLYIAEKKDKKMLAKKVYVSVSKTYNNLSMIESGLKLGDLIITEGFSQVVNGTLINIK